MRSYKRTRTLVSEEQADRCSFLLAENNFDVKTGVENGEISGLRS
jgi:hypothetical protein